MEKVLAKHLQNLAAHIKQELADVIAREISSLKQDTQTQNQSTSTDSSTNDQIDVILPEAPRLIRQ